MNSYEYLKQVIWLNDNFKWNKTTIFFSINWIHSGIIFICDLFDAQGVFLKAEELYGILQKKTNWISQYTIVKKVIMDSLRSTSVDVTLSRHINKHLLKAKSFSTSNGYVDISFKRFNFFYTLLQQKSYERPNVERY